MVLANQFISKTWKANERYRGKKEREEFVFGIWQLYREKKLVKKGNKKIEKKNQTSIGIYTHRFVTNPFGEKKIRLHVGMWSVFLYIFSLLNQYQHQTVLPLYKLASDKLAIECNTTTILILMRFLLFGGFYTHTSHHRCVYDLWANNKYLHCFEMRTVRAWVRDLNWKWGSRFGYNLMSRLTVAMTTTAEATTLTYARSQTNTTYRTSWLNGNIRRLDDDDDDDVDDDDDDDHRSIWS